MIFTCYRVALHFVNARRCVFVSLCARCASGRTATTNQRCIGLQIRASAWDYIPPVPSGKLRAVQMTDLSFPLSLSLPPYHVAYYLLYCRHCETIYLLSSFDVNTITIAIRDADREVSICKLRTSCDADLFDRGFPDDIINARFYHFSRKLT